MTKIRVTKSISLKRHVLSIPIRNTSQVQGKVDHNRFTCPGQWNMQVAELQEVVIRLYNIREAEKELNSCFQV